MTLPLPRVHAVTDDRVAALPRLVELAHAVAAAGRVGIHLRASALSGAALFDLARRLRGALDGTASDLLVNDRADIARLCGAAGVHLPGEGLPAAAARDMLPAGSWIGRSVHSAEEARRAAAEGSDYVFLGPIWETPAHPRRAPLGPEAIEMAQPARVIAIGGVTAARVSVCREAGAYGVAAIRAIWDAPEPKAAVERMLLSLEA